MGQEVGVTALQLITAYSAVANGGVLIQPRLVHDLFLARRTMRCLQFSVIGLSASGRQVS